MSKVSFLLIVFICLGSLSIYGAEKREIEFKFLNTVMLDGDGAYHFLSSLLVPIKEMKLDRGRDFLDLGHDGMVAEQELIAIEYRNESNKTYNMIMHIRATGEEVQLGHVTVTKEGLDSGRGRGFSIIESTSVSKMKLLKIKRYRTGSTGFGCGITGCGFGSTKGFRVLIQFTTESGDQFCLNQGLIKNRALYFKGNCQE